MNNEEKKDNLSTDKNDVGTYNLISSDEFRIRECPIRDNWHYEYCTKEELKIMRDNWAVKNADLIKELES